MQWSWMERRSAGILVHPTALAGDLGLSEELVQGFVAWMRAAGLRLWQILPINPPEGVSPYQCLSSFAVHEGLFASAWLARLMPPEEEVTKALRGEPCSVDAPLLKNAVLAPFVTTVAQQRAAYVAFRVTAALYGGRPFWQWGGAARMFDAAWRNEAAVLRRETYHRIMARQLAAQVAWQRVLHLAHEAGISVIGDVPFFVAANSADVWANRQAFRLFSDGSPAFVAGVPPDYFSKTGQRWGNPQYNWEFLAAHNFMWIRARVAAALGWCDGVRLDHFRGFQAVWVIPAEAPTAETGIWEEVPGEAVLRCLWSDLGKRQLPFIAEDLGVITEEVRRLQRNFRLPGISVLQFGFDGLPDNPHAPMAIPEWQVAVTGTHDNATTVEWWDTIGDEGYRQWILEQLPQCEEPMPWPLIDGVLASKARWAIVPIADWLGLGAEARFNRPGVVDHHNWRWVLSENSLSDELATKIRKRLERFDRCIED